MRAGEGGEGDGTQIAFTSNRDGNLDIYAIRIK